MDEDMLCVMLLHKEIVPPPWYLIDRCSGHDACRERKRHDRAHADSIEEPKRGEVSAQRDG